jgi:hypothetical protein
MKKKIKIISVYDFYKLIEIVAPLLILLNKKFSQFIFINKYGFFDFKKKFST